MNTNRAHLFRAPIPRFLTDHVAVAAFSTVWLMLTIVTSFAAESDPIGKSKWTYNFVDNPPPAGSDCVDWIKASQMASVDNAGNTILIIPFGYNYPTPSPSGARLVWISSNGKLRYSKDFSAGHEISIFSMAPNKVVLKFTSDYFFKLLTLKYNPGSGKVTSSEFELPSNNAAYSSALPPSKGFVVAYAITASIEYVEFRYYP